MEKPTGRKNEKKGMLCHFGLLEWNNMPLLVPIIFLPVVFFSMQLLERGHHSYISSGFGRNCHLMQTEIIAYLPISLFHACYREWVCIL